MTQRKPEIRLVTGPPGTGKTSRIAQIVAESTSSTFSNLVQVDKQVDRDGHMPCLVASLTRTAAREAAGRIADLPKHAIGTLHAHAYRALRKPTLAETVAGRWNDLHPEAPLTRRVFPAWDDDTFPLPQGGSKVGDLLLAECHRLRALGQDPCRALDPYLREFARDWRAWKEECGYLDFTDLVEQARLTTNAAPGTPRVILVDEAQDHTQLELDLVRHWAEAGGADALWLVGDPWQSLYEWRGAVPDVFRVPDVPESHRSVLRQSHRVPRAVHRVANAWIRQLSAFDPVEYEPTEIEGEVRCCEGSGKYPTDIADLAVRKKQEGSVMIAAACDYHLDGILREMRNRGIAFRNPWRPGARKWNHGLCDDGRDGRRRLRAFLRPLIYTNRGYMVRNLANGHAGPDDFRTWTNEELYDWAGLLRTEGADSPLYPHTFERLKWLAGMQPQDPCQTPFPHHLFAQSVRDFTRRMLTQDVGIVQALNWLLSVMRPEHAGALNSLVSSVKHEGFGSLVAEPSVYVGTIHSFKGAEADTVILLPDLSPRAFRDWSGSSADRDAIVRQFYVGMTRARRALYVCSPSSESAVSTLTRLCLMEG